MKISTPIEANFLRLLDFVYAIIPQPLPDKTRFLNCQIVSHRGQHDNCTVLENTIPAFDRIRQAGIWGIEFDIRWTKDHVPICFHDHDLLRVFGSPKKISCLTRTELAGAFPIIPTLEDLVLRYGQCLHLMIELKQVENIDFSTQNRILAKILAGLTPGRDYHLIALSPEILFNMHSFPSQAMLPIARMDVGRYSRAALEKGYGGLTGHYFFIRQNVICRHLGYQQQVGTGFVGSKNTLFRELNRHVTWLFSNDALRLKTICDHFAAHGMNSKGSCT